MTPPPLSLSHSTTTASTTAGGGTTTTTTNTAVFITDSLQQQQEQEKLEDVDSCSVDDSGVGLVDGDDDDDVNDDDDDDNTAAATTTITTTTVASDGTNNNNNAYYTDRHHNTTTRTTANTVGSINTTIETADYTTAATAATNYNQSHHHHQHHHHQHHYSNNNNIYDVDCCEVGEAGRAGVGVGDGPVTTPLWDGRRARGDARVSERTAAPVRNKERAKNAMVDYLYEQSDLHQQLEHQKIVIKYTIISENVRDLYRNIMKLLEDQLQETEKKSKHLEQDLRQQIEELSKENERQKQVISQLNSIATNLSSKTGDEISVTMGQDIIRITTENLELRETVSKQTEQIRKLKKTLKVYARKLKAGEAAEIAAELDRDEQEESGVMAAVKHQEREYLGMLEYNKTDETALIKNLVFDLQPYVAESMLPGLPAYIIFMCIRHTDHINEDDKVCSLLTGVVNGIKRVVKKNSNDIERVTLWLANCCRLLHNLKQYSGEKRYQNTNSPKQNEHCLRNFDLSEYRPVFNDLCVYNYRQLIKVMKENLDKLIVPAILEHEAIAGLNKEDRRGRIPNNEVEPDALDNLQKIMSKYIRILRNHAVDPEVIVLIVKQLFYDMNVKALNNLLLRRDMCNWHKGTQIRYNISHLEQWLREYHLQDSGAFSTMEPLIQASQLLQARKTDADVDSVCQMCPKLKTAQIVKILNQYTPVRGYEDDTVAISFIRKVQEKLAESRQNDTGTNLLMDTQYSFPVSFPFNPSNIALERVTVPDKLHLAFLKRV